MPFGVEQISAHSLKTQEQTLASINRLFDTVQMGTIFSEPINAGDATIITASEVNVGMGVGFGGGMGEGPGESQEEGKAQPTGSGGGIGGGGGGASMARPVAAIIVDRNGVRVEPIVDVTKIVVVLFTALGAIFIALGKMSKAARD